MQPEQKAFLALPRWPARLTMEQAAWVLGFQPYEVSVLVAADLIRPLGSPPRTARKYFLTAECIALSADERWMAKASKAIVSFWQKKNGSRRSQNIEEGELEPSADSFDELSNGEGRPQRRSHPALSK